MDGWRAETVNVEVEGNEKEYLWVVSYKEMITKTINIILKIELHIFVTFGRIEKGENYLDCWILRLIGFIFLIQMGEGGGFVNGEGGDGKPHYKTLNNVSPNLKYLLVSKKNKKNHKYLCK